MMEIYEIAKNLGETIANSELVKRMRKSEDIMLTDSKARELINEYSDAQKLLVDAVNSGKSGEEAASLQGVLKECYEKLLTYDVTSNYFKSKQEFDNMMKQMNDIIYFEITGEEAGKGGCSSGSCSSCSGCN